MEKEKSNNGFIQRLATFIVDKRNLFFLLYGFAIVFSLFSMNWVQVENDVTKYLPEETETRQGIVAMNENFTTFGSARIMVSNITYETAEKIVDMIAEVEGVDMVTFDDSEEHYKNASALIDVSFKGGSMDEISVQAMEQIREKLSTYDIAIDSVVGFDENATLQQEMTFILLVVSLL